MATGVDSFQLARRTRQFYAEEVVRGLESVVQAVRDAALRACDLPAEPELALRRRDVLQEVTKSGARWRLTLIDALKRELSHYSTAARYLEAPPRPVRAEPSGPLTLVEDSTIEEEIVTSRLALAMMDKASWEFSDLCARVASLEHRAELDPHDLLRATTLAKLAFEAWRKSGLSLPTWRELQATLHGELSVLVQGAYHEANRWLVDQGVLPEVDLRPGIRRARQDRPAAAAQGFVNSRSGNLAEMNAGASGAVADSGFMRGMGGTVAEETRLMTQRGHLARHNEQPDAVLSRLNRLVARHLPAFGDQTRAQTLSPDLARAIDTVQVDLRERMTQHEVLGEAEATTPALLEELHQRKQALKQAASTPEERATIEVVALLFQSLLTEERLPAAVRVWFARLQMPVLRVAVQEPDFFATVDHPARRLIDRMGACVMGFDSGDLGVVSEALQKEIKRVVQVVEAYPDTGRRVFQTVLTEFEQFLETYFKDHNEASRKGVSLAQQVEQRETLAIQYTIELRRMLAEVPVQEGVRQFLFHVWADVLATTAVRDGVAGESIKRMKRAAADLIWSASAKVTREERAEVIRRLPPLLKALREGMSAAGLEAEQQDEHLRQLNNSLAAAFTARAAAIPMERLTELMQRLETLEEMLPDAADLQIDEAMVTDLAGLSGPDTGELEIVEEGGSMATPAMLAWARELQVGSWFMLDYGGRNEAVQLAWQGMRKQLTLFVSARGRCVLFQLHRLAAFLQAGLLLPAQDEALTVRATRDALAKLDVDASRLLN